MTSNIGSAHLMEGINSRGEISEPARERVLAELRRHFRPEFLNRVDATVLFKPLQIEEIERIVDLLMKELRGRLAARNITLELTDRARVFVAKEGFDPVFGARPLKRFLQSHLETRLGRAIIAGDVEDGSAIVVDEIGGEISVRTKGLGSAEVGAKGRKTTRH